MLPHIFTDFESTDANPYAAEILTGYFESLGGKSYLFESQVNKWSEQAEKIHKITEFEANMFDSKHEADRKLVSWLPKEFVLICYANPNTQHGYMLYDLVLLQLRLMDYFKVSKPEHLPIKIHGKTVHSMAKEAYEKCFIDVITNGEAFELGILTKKKYKGSNRKSFRQAVIYYSLFQEFYDAHDAKADVKAMIRIYKTLLDCLENSKSLKDVDQLVLI